jgi:hypothetical protein
MAKSHATPKEFKGSATQLLEVARKSRRARKPLPQDFSSVAARLECDPDLKKFDARLKKIAKVKPASKAKR